MKKTLTTITAMIAAMLLLGGVVRAAELSATLNEVQGDVQVIVDGSATAATNGQSVAKEAKIKTGPDGEAVLTWGEGNAVQISPLSIVKVENLTAEADGSQTSLLSMEQGKIMAKAAELKTSDSSFQIKTPSAVAGVRGTGFECNMPPGSTDLTVSVVDGNVVLAVGDVEISIPAGLMSFVPTGGLPQEPIQIPLEKLQNLQSTLNKIRVITKQLEHAQQKQEKKEEKQERQQAKSDDTNSDKPSDEEIDSATGDDATDDTLDTVTDSVTDTVIDQTVDDTITNDITDTIEDLIDECPAGGGCIEGTIDIHYGDY